MPKCDFIIEITLCHGCSPVNFLHVFRTPFPKNTSGGLLLYPAILLKEATPAQVFSDDFCDVRKTLFYRAPPRNCFCSTEKYFTDKIVKSPLREEKNGNS